jgi:hypothetical protein
MILTSLHICSDLYAYAEHKVQELMLAVHTSKEPMRALSNSIYASGTDACSEHTGLGADAYAEHTQQNCKN